jgi:hypothetical protein
MIGLSARTMMAAVALAAASSTATAQSSYCDRLRSELAGIERAAGSARSQPYSDAIRRQRGELDRTIAYARSIGCQRQGFFPFGGPPPAQCGAIEAQINRMEAGLAQLDAQAQRSGGAALDAQRNSILAALDSNCRGIAPGLGAQRQPGLFEQLFGGAPGRAEVPAFPEDEPSPMTDDTVGLAGAGKTLCVRKCDGYYFPISPNAGRGRFEADATLCQASCPNADVELFVQPGGTEMSEAVSLSGTVYSSLPNAFRYRTSFDSSCTCRRPGQSWVEALAEAERVLVDKRSTDVTVTEQQSLELSRPREPAKPAAPAQAPRAASTNRPAGSAAPRAGTPPPARPSVTNPPALRP